MKQLFLLWAALCSMLLLGCSEEVKESQMPTFSGFEYEKPVVPGQMLTITAKQSALGKYLYTTTYTWTCTCTWYDEEEETEGTLICYGPTTTKINYGVTPDDPSVTFQVPKNAIRLRVAFVAEYNYAAQGPSRYDGSNIGEASMDNGFIMPVSSNSLCGKTQGSVSIRIGK